MVLAMLVALQMPKASDVGTALPAFGRAVIAWKTCTGNVVQDYSVSTKEPAEAVVDAAIGQCNVAYTKCRETAIAAVGVRDSGAILKTMMDDWRPILVAGVFHLRTLPTSPARKH